MTGSSDTHVGIPCVWAFLIAIIRSWIDAAPGSHSSASCWLVKHNDVPNRLFGYDAKRSKSLTARVPPFVRTVNGRLYSMSISRVFLVRWYLVSAGWYGSPMKLRRISSLMLFFARYNHFWVDDNCSPNRSTI